MVETNFKQTEIGLIPEDWCSVAFTEVAHLRHGFQFLEHHFTSSGIGVVKIGNLIASCGINLSNLTYIGLESLAHFKRYKLEYGDVLMALTGATLGKVCRVDNNDVLLQNYRVGNFIPSTSLDKGFLYYLSQSELVQKTVKDLVNSGAQPNLGKADFDKILIPLPELKEQQSIAKALSDTDAWIESLEKLIAKKRLIKQGAMQQLLTPKEDWEVKKLGDFLDYLQPTKYLVRSTEYNDYNSIPVLTAGKTFILGYTNETDNVFDKLPVIIFDDFTTATKFVDFPFKAKSSAMKMLIPKHSNSNIRFIYEIMQMSRFQVGDHKRHWIGEFQSFDIKVPKDTKEQTRIANILSDMDKEIDAIENKLQKAQQIKQGMMQQLLTGKIRLVAANKAVSNKEEVTAS